jgi:hypothetical protein
MLGPQEASSERMMADAINRAEQSKLCFNLMILASDDKFATGDFRQR